MTKIIILGNTPCKITKRPIQFIKYLDQYGNLDKAVVNPDSYDTIELVSKNYGSDLDLMFATKGTDRADGVLYLGHFNDGVV